MEALTYHAQPQDHAAPEEHVVEQGAPSHPLASLHHDNGHLQHHCEKSVASELARNTTHDQLVRKRRYEESDCGRNWARHVVLRCRVDVTTEEVVNWLIPKGMISKKHKTFERNCTHHSRENSSQSQLFHQSA